MDSWLDFGRLCVGLRRLARFYDNGLGLHTQKRLEYGITLYEVEYLTWIVRKLGLRKGKEMSSMMMKALLSIAILAVVTATLIPVVLRKQQKSVRTSRTVSAKPNIEAKKSRSIQVLRNLPESILAREGEAYRRQGDYVRAIGKFRASLAIQPANALIRDSLAQSLIAENRGAEAYTELRSIVIQNRSSLAASPDVLCQFADLAEEYGNVAEAQQVIQERLDRIPLSSRKWDPLPQIIWGSSTQSKRASLYLCASAVTLNDNPIKGLALARKALAIEPSNAIAAVYAAYAALLAEKPDEVITGYLNEVGQSSPPAARVAAAFVRSQYPPYPPKDRAWPSGP